MRRRGCLSDFGSVQAQPTNNIMCRCVEMATSTGTITVNNMTSGDSKNFTFDAIYDWKFVPVWRGVRVWQQPSVFAHPRHPPNLSVAAHSSRIFTTRPRGPSSTLSSRATTVCRAEVEGRV